MLESNHQNTPRKDNFGSVIVAKGSHKIKIDELRNTEHDMQKSEEYPLDFSGIHNLALEDGVSQNEEVKQ